jgi:hypothetical protein
MAVHDIREIETEVQEQAEGTADISFEVARHKEQALQLETAVVTLLSAQQHVDSEGIRRAIDEASTARYATEERLSELRQDRDSLLERNDELQQLCQASVEKLQDALSKLPHLTWGTASGSIAPGEVGFSTFGVMQSSLNETLQRTANAQSELKAIRRRLEELPI